MIEFLLMIMGIMLGWALLWWMIAMIIGRYDVADVAWGLTFVLIVWICIWIDGTTTRGQMLSTIVVSVWGIRLALHLFLRMRQRDDDFRYQKISKSWGDWTTVRSFTDVFLLQAMLALVISFPVISMVLDGARTGWLELIGIGIAGIGIVIEGVADWQLSQFKTIADGHQVMDQGLWRYSRHPNYFGESLVWWGLGIAAISTPLSWLVLVGPVVITYLLLYVSGVPQIERRYADNDEYQKYAQLTSKFILWPPNA